MAVVLFVGRRRTVAADWAAVSAAAAVVAGLFLPAQFYDHYAYFLAAFVAVLLGVAAGLFSSGLTALVRRRSYRSVTAAIASAVAPLAPCASVALTLPPSLGQALAYFEDATDPSEVVSTIVPRGGCVVFDDPVVLLVGDRSGRLTRPALGWSTRSGCG